MGGGAATTATASYCKCSICTELPL